MPIEKPPVVPPEVYAERDRLLAMAQEDADAWLRLALVQLEAQLRAMTTEQREKAFERIRELFCIHCGVEQPKSGMWCQCTNDE